MKYKMKQLILRHYNSVVLNIITSFSVCLNIRYVEKKKHSMIIMSCLVNVTSA